MSKLKDSNFPPQIPDVPISTRDRMIKEIWCEIKGLPKPTYADVWDGPIEPKIQEIKEKYAGNKDLQNQMTVLLYQEANVS